MTLSDDFKPQVTASNAYDIFIAFFMHCYFDAGTISISNIIVYDTSCLLVRFHYLFGIDSDEQTFTFIYKVKQFFCGCERVDLYPVKFYSVVFFHIIS